MKLCIQMLLRKADPQFQSPLDPGTHEMILRILLRLLPRARRWPLPPTWSAPDWQEELRQTAFEAALAAQHQHNPAAHDGLALCVYRRAHAAVATRFRKEWAYQKHRVTSPDLALPDFTPQSAEFLSPQPPPDQLASVHELLRPLSYADRVLIVRIVAEGSTESELADALHLSQRAVSKRKRAILLRLRKQLTARVQGENSQLRHRRVLNIKS